MPDHRHMQLGIDHDSARTESKSIGIMVDMKLESALRVLCNDTVLVAFVVTTSGDGERVECAPEG